MKKGVAKTFKRIDARKGVRRRRVFGAGFGNPVPRESNRANSADAGLRQAGYFVHREAGMEKARKR